eukprot:CAMPEP_0173174404 /NCGR_PEP_ID=MMETSP1141-20130122/3336_1 /TAXON_ID=483371 /ORGANISM="non described non described, Strain CCMP2298" /LENGTH=379 /DNA_ID=CAMNT_0014096529 /DNA_START=249 /DNA_END=1388 /DNA_ORIENTATION=-
MGVAACVVFYSSVQFDVGGRDLEELCKAYVPLLCYFFLVSAGWTTMLALRFRSSQHVPATTNKPPLPLWSVWVLPIVPAVAALVVAALVPGVTSVRTNSDRTNHACVFDPTTTQGVATDFVLYQTPLIIMLAFNMYNYLRGLLALRNAPQSVLARSMKKAGGYMSVLFLVWVPVIVYNFVAASSRHGYSYDYFFDIAVILQASQGFLNSLVYVYTNPTMMDWLWGNCVILRLTRRDRDISSEKPQAGVESPEYAGSPSSGGAHSGNPAGVEAGTGTEGPQYESDEDEAIWIRDGGLRAERAERGAREFVVNALMHTGGTGAANRSASVNSLTSSTHSSRSIMIGEQSQKAIDVKAKKGAGGVRYYPDVDSEKFVRFGGV